MRHRFLLSTEARFDLLAIWEYIALDNPKAADRVVTRIRDFIRLLARFPRKGHTRADVHTSESVLFWPVGSYVIVYRPTTEPLAIVRIIHGARDLDALL